MIKDKLPNLIFRMRLPDSVEFQISLSWLKQTQYELENLMQRTEWLQLVS